MQPKTVYPIAILIWFVTQIMATAIENYDLVAIVDCDQKAKKVAVHTLRNRNNIGEALINELAKAQLISIFLSNESDKKAILLYSRTKNGSQSQGIWIREGNVTLNGKMMKVEDLLRLLDVDKPHENHKEAEQAAPRNR